MTNKEILAQRISALREEAKVTRQKAADDLGVTRAALEFYEKGKRTPDVGMIARLAEYYGVSADYLLGVVDFRNPENEKPATELHLSEKAVDNLSECYLHGFSSTLNLFLESDEFLYIIQIIEDLVTYIPEPLLNDLAKELLKDSKEKSVNMTLFVSILKRELSTLPSAKLTEAKHDIYEMMNQFLERVAAEHSKSLSKDEQSEDEE